MLGRSDGVLYVPTHSSPTTSYLAVFTETQVAFDLAPQRSMRFLTCAFQAGMLNMLSWTTWR